MVSSGSSNSSTDLTGGARTETRVADPGSEGAPAPLDASVSVELRQRFGPLQVDRIGLAYGKGVLWLTVDGALSVAGFTVAVQGLGLGLDLNTTPAEVRTRLEGLAVELARPPVLISGVFVNRMPPPGYDLMVGGQLTVQIPALAITAAGVYQRRSDGMASLFLFGEAYSPSGASLFGPPPFTVTGLSGGFGLNSSIRVPAPSEVGSFPLVARLNDPSQPLTPLQALDRLLSWVSAAEGQYWIAVGLQFTTFRFIETRAVVVAEFGASWKVMLLGRTSITFPRNAGAVGTVHARLNIDVRLAYIHDEGLLAMDVVVGPGSFLFDPACELTGGIAVYVWTRGSHAGDFVISIGGYHRDFNRPAHYPNPPRLGFSWAPDSKILIKAEAYTALTPSSFMLGGALAATYSSGLLQAWFTARLNVLIRWKPFALDFDLAISIGVAFTVKILFVKVRVSIEVGIDLRIWTPPFGGRGTVHVWFISFSFDFGSRRPSIPPATWTEFSAQLPSPLRVALEEGLLVDVDDQEVLARARVNAPPLVSSAGFTFSTRAALPSTSVTLNSDPEELDPDVPATISIRPMDLPRVISLHKVTVKLDDMEFPVKAREWKVEVIYESLPQAQWGKPLAKPNDSLNEDALIKKCATGLRIAVPEPELDDPTGPITVEALGVVTLAPGSMPLRNPTPTGPQPDRPEDRSVIDLIAGSIVQTATKRTDAFHALSALGLPLPDANDALTDYAELTHAYFTDEPMLTAAA
ncbi:DUF6603 domain-containing protein [Streptomyces lavendulae]|uniref:DUF6603 domain-containing protein n=1 Tax=Streptomyces lavendulae TaxID=1914 RepID=UPI0036862215